MIGDVEIPNRTVLAPMAGVTNSAFRTIAKELGAGLVVMEMVSDKGIQYNNEKTLHMLHIDERRKSCIDPTLWKRRRQPRTRS